MIDDIIKLNCNSSQTKQTKEDNMKQHFVIVQDLTLRTVTNRLTVNLRITILPTNMQLFPNYKNDEKIRITNRA